MPNGVTKGLHGRGGRLLWFLVERARQYAHGVQSDVRFRRERNSYFPADAAHFARKRGDGYEGKKAPSARRG